MQGIPKLYKLQGTIQDYAWGGKQFLPALLGFENSHNAPFAEYWLGAHENSSSTILADTGEHISLKSFIDTDPVKILGEKVFRKFGRLPYLLKVLDVEDMLSIQVHPNKEEAAKSFDEENRKNIPLDAPHRNYKDKSHKPELAFALSEFWLLHGFRKPESIRTVLTSVPELNFLLPIFKSDGYAALYRAVMEMPQPEVDKHLQPLLDRIISEYNGEKLNKDEPDFWAARAATTFRSSQHIDRGIFSIYLLNLVHLNPGEVIFQDAGILHAYLEGRNIELMANSDNVLRGGLTQKHIDLPELLKHVLYKPVEAHILRAHPSGNPHELLFPAPVEDFQLSHIELKKNAHTKIKTYTTDIFFVLQGNLQVSSGKEGFELSSGDAFLAIANTPLGLESFENAVVFRATVPVGQFE